jgi:hypothetical protein
LSLVQESVSSGPTKYGSVVLPDADIIAELPSRGQVFRTDTNDVACESNPSKIGPDNDGQPVAATTSAW